MTATDPYALTILRCASGRRAAKLHTRTPDGSPAPWSTQDYDTGATFALTTHHAPDLPALSALLSSIEGDPRAFVIRGQRIDGALSHPKTRRTIKQDAEGNDPHLCDVDRAWCLLDIDGLSVPTDDDGKPLGDRAGWVRYAVACLPAPFATAGYHWQWSASAGVKGWGTIRLHLWFILDRPVCGRSLKAYLAAESAPIDPSMYSANQVHYTSAPLFIDADGHPLPDTVTPRSGMTQGPPVALPPTVLDLAAQTDADARAADAARRQAAAQAERLAAARITDAQRQDAIARYVAAAIVAACDEIRAAAKGERHRTLYAQAAALGELVGAGALSRPLAVDHLLAAAQVAYAGEDRAGDYTRTISEGLDVGQREPRDLSAVGALTRTASPRHDAPPPTDDDAPPPLRHAAKPQRNDNNADDNNADDNNADDNDDPYAPDEIAPQATHDDDAPPPSYPVCDLGEPHGDPDQTYSLTHEGDGQRLAAAYGHALRYIYDRDAWAYWSASAQAWTLDHGSRRAAAVGHLSRVCAVVAERIKAEGRIAADRARRLALAEAIAQGNPPARADQIAAKAAAATSRAYAAHHKAACSVGGRDAMLAVAASLPQIRTHGSQWDAHPHLLGVLNGVVDLRTARLLPPDPARLMLRRCPVAYDKAAEAPAFSRFLDEITRQQDGQDTPEAREKRAYLLRVMGYFISGEMREQRFWTFTGPGSNGKSLLIECLTTVLGDASEGGYSADIDFSSIAASPHAAGAPRPDLAKLPGVRFVVTSEPSQGVAYDEGLLKKWTGQDPITARLLYKDDFTFRPCCKLAVLCNAKPIIKGTDAGIWRRVEVITFARQYRTSPLMPATLPAADPRLRERLRAEAEGILALLVAHARGWYAVGLQTPEQITDEVKSYRAASDTFELFLEEECERGPEYTVQSSALGTAYNAWAKATKAPTLTPNALADELLRRGFTKGRTSAGYRWHGLRLTLDGPPAHTDDDAPAPRTHRGTP